MQEIDSRYTAKIPVQARSKLRFNNILSAAEELILEIGIDELSPHKIAKKAGIPAASVYQYFPSMGILFSTMAEVHFVKSFDLVDEAIEAKNISNWQEMTETLIDVAYSFYTQDKISEILFLSAFVAPGVRELSGIRLTRLGHWFSHKYAVLYPKVDTKILAEKLSICNEVMKGVYIRSLSIHGEIKLSYKTEAQIIIKLYLEEYLSHIEQ